MVGLFAPPASLAGGAEREAVKQSVFLRLKAVTVPLLDVSRSPVSSQSSRTILDLLDQLARILDETPAHSFSSALANYAFFPLTSLLQPRPDGVSRGDRVLEATMQGLKELAIRWRQAGMEDRVRKELWTMTILTLGGPLNVRDGAKGKEVDRTEESKLAMVELLEVLMRSQKEVQAEEEEEEEEEVKQDANDSNRTSPPDQPAEEPPSLSILFHTLTTLLALAVDQTSLVQLQLSSISALRIITTFYLAPSPSAATTVGPSSLLATSLPGMASTLSRIALSKPSSSKVSFETPGRKQSSPVIVASLHLLVSLVRLSVSDQVTIDLRERGNADPTSTVSLEDLVRRLDDPPSTSDDDPHTPEERGAESSTPPTGPTTPTPAWLRYTVTSLSSLLRALSPLASHHSADVRTALVGLLDEVVRDCSSTFGPSLEDPLEGLLVMSRDGWDVVSSPARRALLKYIESSTAPSTAPPLDLLGKIVRRRLAAFPLHLRKREEDSIRRSGGVVQASLDILPIDQALEDVISNVTKWSWNLLASFELERVVAATGGGSAAMTLAWIDDGATRGGDARPEFPAVRLRHIHDDSTVEALDALWTSFGRGAARIGKEDTLIENFLGVALGPRREESVAANALWIVEGMLKGLSTLALDKRKKRFVKAVAKSIVGFLEELETEDSAEFQGQEEEAAHERDTMSQRDSSLPALLDTSEGEVLPAILHTKGTTAIPSLSEYKPVVSQTTSSQDRASQRILLHSLSLRILATTSSLLGTSFQALLLPALYHVLSSSSATTHPLLRSHAQAALSVIAASTSHASPQELVLSNVDYVVNSVSQRMSVTRLDPSAPLVLVEMIRLVGKPIVGIVQDLVDDVFEALDDYHGYEEVTVGLWAVLDALLKAMEEDLPVAQKTDSAPAAVSKFNAFKGWLKRRNDALDQDPTFEEATERNPEKPFTSESADAADSTQFPETESTAVAPTRPQVVTAQILSKALYFLSHPSPFLRARVLSLISSAVPLLARPSIESKDRSADLLPVIHRAWPFILNRLADPELPVVVEAANLIESLATHVGDFMSRRILDDVWPRFRTILTKQEIDDASSALSSSTRFSNSHRLYHSILRTLLDVARHVPLKEEVLWEQCVLLRRFLSTSTHRDLEECAVELYRTLGKVNRDAVWLVLAGTVGATEGLPEFLLMDQIELGVASITLLAEL
ncbi:hypothetical protein JCM3766R1_004154 [Sporobolomyces carnicolor]